MVYRAIVYSAAVFAFGASFATAALAADRPPSVDQSHPTAVSYPVAAQAAGEEGTAVVGGYVSSSGKPEKASLAQSTGFNDLDDAAVSTAMNWHYVPGIKDGETTSEWLAVEIAYRLPQSAAK